MTAIELAELRDRIRRGQFRVTDDESLRLIAEVERLQAENREAQQFCRDADEAAHNLRVQVEAKDTEIRRLHGLPVAFADPGK